MRALVVVHRWLGIAFCLLFAMWFATGIVMHFVPYPNLTERERVEGLAPIGSSTAVQDPAAALAASAIHDAVRVRLVRRVDGLVYIVQGASAVKAVNASDLSLAVLRSDRIALAVAVEHARRRGLDVSGARLRELAAYDQWTVPNALDVHRPLYRINLNDAPRTEIYVSSITGEVVRDTTRRERVWNYVGSVLHWIYPTVLRRNWGAWDATVWTLSLIAAVTALAGGVLGVLRIRFERGRVASPFHGWHAWHHWAGLITMLFVLTWIVSGWLSMDHGRFFSTGQLRPDERAAFTGTGGLGSFPAGEIERIGTDAREIEWFAFGGKLYRREHIDFTAQRLSLAGEPVFQAQAQLSSGAVSTAARRISAACGPAAAVLDADSYPVARSVPAAPVYRLECGEVWFQVDSADGRVLEKLDRSRRMYRWAYSALHTFDVPELTVRPKLRSALVVVLCALGFGFSVTAVVIGWRRLRQQLASGRP